MAGQTEQGLARSRAPTDYSKRAVLSTPVFSGNGFNEPRSLDKSPLAIAPISIL